MNTGIYPGWSERFWRGLFHVFIPYVVLPAIFFGAGWMGFQLMGPKTNTRDSEFRNDLEKLRQEVLARDLRIGAIERDVSTRLTTPPVSPRLDVLAGDLKDLTTRLTAADAAIKELRDRPVVKPGGKVDLSGITKDLTSLKKELKKLDEGFSGRVAKLVAPSKTEIPKLDLAPITKRLDALDEALKAVEKKFVPVADVQKWKDDLSAARAEKGKVEKTLKSTEEKVVALQGKLERVVKAEPVDVLIVGISSANLSLHRYKELLRDFVDPTKQVAGRRIALGMAEGREWVTIAKFGDEIGTIDKNFTQIAKARDGTIDRLNDLRDEIKSALKDSKDAKKSVVIASLACQPPPKSAHGDWKGLQPDVILIGKEDRAGDLDKDRVRQWMEFCRACGGTLTILGTPDDPEKPDSALLEPLRRALLQSTQPRYSLPKR